MVQENAVQASKEGTNQASYSAMTPLNHSNDHHDVMKQEYSRGMHGNQQLSDSAEDLINKWQQDWLLEAQPTTQG